MKLLRGAWTEGLSAIHPVVTLAKGKILRPFLNTRRAEIEAFLNSRSQPWREDSSNSDTALLAIRSVMNCCLRCAATIPTSTRRLPTLPNWRAKRRHGGRLSLPAFFRDFCFPGDRFEVGAALSVLRRVKVRSRSSLTGFGRSILRCGGGFFEAAARQLGARLSFEETSRLLALCGFPGSIRLWRRGLTRSSRPAERALRQP